MPSRVSLPEPHARRILDILSRLGAKVSDEDGVSAANAAAWLLGVLQAQHCPSQQFRDLVNGLRPEWALFPAFDAMEENHFRANEPDLRDLRACDWELMRDFLAYLPRDGESFFQVQKRQTFLQSPEDTLGAAIRWQKTHRRKSYIAPKKQQESTHHDGEISTLMKEVFGDANWNQP